MVVAVWNAVAALLIGVTIYRAPVKKGGPKYSYLTLDIKSISNMVGHFGHFSLG